MRWRCVPAAVRYPLGFPKPLPEGAAGSAALVVTLGGAAPRLPRWAGGNRYPPARVVNLTQLTKC
jgi:hypothetical protein